MLAPRLPWDSEENSCPAMVWRAKLDNRYLIEVTRDSYSTAMLRMFDHDRGDVEIVCRQVALAYGARFGPDPDDIASWQESCATFIDREYRPDEPKQ